MEYLIIIVGNFLIGGMIGLTGIAGFLLPMLYSGFLGMSSAQGLALSFFAFLISGCQEPESEACGLDQYGKFRRRCGRCTAQSSHGGGNC